MPPRRAHRSERGFTLIEVLIALVLSVMLATLLFNALHTYVLSSSTAHKTVAARQISESVYHFIRDQLREAVPLVLNTTAGRRVLFFGDERNIVYVGNIPSHRSAGGLHKNALTIRGTRPHQTLSFSYARLDSDQAFDSDTVTALDAGDARALLAASSIAFEYFGRSGTDKEPAWHRRWSHDKRLPELIRVRIEKTGELFAPDIVVPVYANAATQDIALSLGQAAQWSPNDLIRGRSGVRALPAAGASGTVPGR